MPSRNFIVHNFRWKLLSLLLAGLVWLTIQMDLQKDEVRARVSQESPVITTSRRTFPAIPLVLMTVATETNRLKTTPATVSVELTGSAEDLKKLEPGDVQALVDATDIEYLTLFRRKIRVEVPPNVRVDVVTPAYASVERVTTAK